jgi:alcohol dehydrogenase class IV
MISRFSFPTRIVFGVGAVQEVGDLAKKVGGTRALIVTDKGVAAAGLIAPVQQALEAAGVPSVVFDGVAPNPTEANVDEGIAAYRGAGSDFIIGVGGGSPLDGAKAIRLRVTHTLPLEEYDDNIGGDAKIKNDMPPMLALPTTAGTGSEVGRSTVIICKANDRKTVIFSPYLMADYALCDPQMTAGMPPIITAATGMDAFTHNIESYLAPPYHPLSDAVSLYGMMLCGKSLRRAVENGQDLDARGDMMMAAIMGATAFQKGLGVTHSLAHPLSSIGGMHHGMANAVLLPYVLEFNTESCPQKYLDIAKTLDLPAKPEAVTQWVRDLNASIGVPAKLGSFGITPDMIPAMVEKALLDGCYLTNPRTCTADDMRALYAAAL